MNKEQQAAYITAQAAYALIEAMGMQADNGNRQATGLPGPWTKKDFDGLIERYGIHHNAVIGYFYP
jgi:hypothetical protein